MGTFKAGVSCRESALRTCKSRIAKLVPLFGEGFTVGRKKTYVTIFEFHSPPRRWNTFKERTKVWNIYTQTVKKNHIIPKWQSKIISRRKRDISITIKWLAWDQRKPWDDIRYSKMVSRPCASSGTRQIVHDRLKFGDGKFSH